ncbi:Eisosome component PIL1-domain-containing protein [Pyrenochaeta sp. MPI-SDFR-AT-0127]|nr:Eisosome component PIL1-domain-containing protein [Pyrenochaeta sp. MPI-SDFR-AT-0127]
MNRSLSTRSKKGGASDKAAPKHRFTMASLRGTQQPELSKRLYKIIKSENHAIGAYEAVARERVGIAQQLSEWGEATEDETISDISDKLGVLLAEIAEQEDHYAQGLEEYRGILKQIRNTESSVQPSRDHKSKVSDEIAKLKYKEPQSTKIVQLEQELVRAEAQSLVAEAQLSNITRQKFKEAYDHHFAATIERAEKQIILAKHARRLLNLVDDTPIVPGDTHPAFTEAEAARQVLTDAEDDLRNYELQVEPIHSHSGDLGAGAMPGSAVNATNHSVPDNATFGSTTNREGLNSERSYETQGALQGGGEAQAPSSVTEAERLEGQQQAPRQEVASAV